MVRVTNLRLRPLATILVVVVGLVVLVATLSSYRNGEQQQQQQGEDEDPLSAWKSRQRLNELKQKGRQQPWMPNQQQQEEQPIEEEVGVAEEPRQGDQEQAEEEGYKQETAKYAEVAQEDLFPEALYSSARLAGETPQVDSKLLQSLAQAIEQYAGWASGQSREDAKYVVYRCQRNALCGGFGDRLYGTITAFYLAMSSQRLLMLDWESPAPIAEFMSPYLFDWRYDPAVLQGGEQFHLRYIDSFDPRSVEGQDWSVISQKVIICEGNILLMNPFKRNVRIKEQWNEWGITGLDVHTLARGAIRAMYRPADRFTEVMNQFYQKYPPSTHLAVGVQIRSGDQTTWHDPRRVDKISIPCFVDKAMQIAGTIPERDSLTPVIFLTTDSLSFVEAFKKRFQETYPDVQVVTLDQFPRNHLDRAAVGDPLEAYAGTFVDWFLLASMDVRVLSRSNFAYTSSLHAGTGRKDVLYDGKDPKACEFLPFSINKIATQ